MSAVEAHVDGHGRFNPLMEEESLETVFNRTSSLSQVARSAAEDVTSYKEEFRFSQTIIPFYYEVRSDGRWTNHGKTIDEMVDPDEAGGDRLGRVLTAERYMRGNPTVTQAAVFSEDLGFGRHYVYLYNRQGNDLMRATAIEFQGNESDFARLYRNLSEEHEQKTDFTRPLFFREEKTLTHVFDAVKESYQTPTERLEKQEYLDRLARDVVSFPLIIEQRERQLNQLAEKLEREMLTYDDVRQAFSHVAHTLALSVSDQNIVKPQEKTHELKESRNARSISFVDHRFSQAAVDRWRPEQERSIVTYEKTRSISRKPDEKKPVAPHIYEILFGWRKKKKAAEAPMKPEHNKNSPKQLRMIPLRRVESTMSRLPKKPITEKGRTVFTFSEHKIIQEHKHIVRFDHGMGDRTPMQSRTLQKVRALDLGANIGAVGGSIFLLSSLLGERPVHSARRLEKKVTVNKHSGVLPPAPESKPVIGKRTERKKRHVTPRSVEDKKKLQKSKEKRRHIVRVEKKRSSRRVSTEKPVRKLILGQRRSVVSEIRHRLRIQKKQQEILPAQPVGPKEIKPKKSAKRSGKRRVRVKDGEMVKVKEKHHSAGRGMEVQRKKRLARVLRRLLRTIGEAGHPQDPSPAIRKSAISELIVTPKALTMKKRNEMRIRIAVFTIALLQWATIHQTPNETKGKRRMRHIHRVHGTRLIAETHNVSHAYKDTFQKKERLSMERGSPWILLAIIWYLAQIREQGKIAGGRKTNVVGNKKRTKSKKKSPPVYASVIPHAGVIYAFHS